MGNVGKNAEKKFQNVTGITASKKAARAQRGLIARQKQKEQLTLAEEEDELKRRKYLAKAGGRRSLIASNTASKGDTSLLGG